MYRFYLAVVDLLPAVLILVPVYWVLNKAYFHNSRKSFLYFLFSCYLSIVYVLVGLPNVTYIRPELNLNVVPIIGMIDDWKNSILNILLFVPLGAVLPVLWHKFKIQKNTVLFGFSVSFAIELLQTLTYRATDVNDLITNTLGTYLGFLCARHLFQKNQVAEDSNTNEVGIVIVIVMLIMFFVYPFASSAFWDLILS